MLAHLKSLLQQSLLGMRPHSLSPWLHQLNRKRPVTQLTQDIERDVAIVGAGIAGVATAYFTLRYTSQSVVLIEGDRVAHGATGHNAGQIVSYFERQVSDLVKEFGLEKTAQAQTAIDSGWVLLEEIYRDTELKTPFAQFTGYAGLQDLDEVIIHLENILCCQQANINLEPMMVAAGSEMLKRIPAKYAGLYSVVPHFEILNLLETRDSRFVALISGRKGVMNSALFCEDLVNYLLTRYADRFSLYEKSPIDSVVLNNGSGVLEIDRHRVTAKKIILCTNGFEGFTIRNQVGPDINTKFHHTVRGCIGYMAGYLEPHTRSPIAISYLPAKSHTGDQEFDDHPYFYLTRRTFELEPNQTHSLVCVGGPENRIDDTNEYQHHDHPYPEEAHQVMDEFLHRSYAFSPRGKIHYHYQWHGLMGYTPNGVRRIGLEPLNPVLLYNLGCNGVGILPSIYGGKKISQFLNGEQLPKSIFDPQ